MPTASKLAVAVCLTSLCSFGAIIVGPSYSIAGNYSDASLSGDTFAAAFPANELQGIPPFEGLRTTGPIVLDPAPTDNAALSVSYDASIPVFLPAGDYYLISYMDLVVTTIYRSSSSGYVQDAQVATSLFDSANDIVAQSVAGQVGLPSDFALLSAQPELFSGSTQLFTIPTSGNYTLVQSFLASVSGLSAGDVVTMTLPNTSAIGIPEPGSSLLLLGAAALLLARSRRRS